MEWAFPSLRLRAVSGRRLGLRLQRTAVLLDGLSRLIMVVGKHSSGFCSYCGLVGDPHLTAKKHIFAPLPVMFAGVVVGLLWR